jgi:hypothetical protein
MKHFVSYSLAGLLAFAFCPIGLGEELRVSRHTTVFTQPPSNVPTNRTPDGPLTGNGDIGLVIGGTPDRLTFYIGKNDFWNAWPTYPDGGIAFPGGLTVNIPALEGASYAVESIFDQAYIRGRFEKDGLVVELKAWVAATENLIVLELRANRTNGITLDLWTPEDSAPWDGVSTEWGASTIGSIPESSISIREHGVSGGASWVTRTFPKVSYREWESNVALAMRPLNTPHTQVFTMEDGHFIPTSQQRVSLVADRTATIVIAAHTNFDSENWKETSIELADSMSRETVDALWQAHVADWREFWQSSEVRLDDPMLEYYYYVSQYIMGCSVRGNRFPPGIWGPFITRDRTLWGGDYHLNYNYQAPFWAMYSSNMIDRLDTFDDPLLDFMDRGRGLAQELLGMRGIYYPVGIGPRGSCPAKWPLTPDDMERGYATRENTIDGGYKILGQKINAVFSVGNMLMRFYSTYDDEYAKRIYPYMLACADFWEDFLSFEEGRYVVRMCHFNEEMPNVRNQGQWRDRLGDVNSVLALGLVEMLFKGILDVAKHLDIDQDRYEKWEHILEHLSDYPIAEVDGRRTLRNIEETSRGPGRTGLERVSMHGLIIPGGVAGPITTPELNEIFLSDLGRWRDRPNVALGGWGGTRGNGIETVFPSSIRVGYDTDFVLERLKERIQADVFPNGWIVAGGGGIETLAAVPMTINEAMMQSYEHVIRVFPGWNRNRDAAFDNLRAYGAFLVSSEVKDGDIPFVRIVSEKGRKLKMEIFWKADTVYAITRNGQSVEVSDLILSSSSDREFLELDTNVGDVIELRLRP